MYLPEIRFKKTQKPGLIICIWTHLYEGLTYKKLKNNKTKEKSVQKLSKRKIIFFFNWTYQDKY